jgi:hypothetical protein
MSAFPHTRALASVALHMIEVLIYLQAYYNMHIRCFEAVYYMGLSKINSAEQRR